MSIVWKKTDKHVYGAIYREHHNDLQPFGTCSAPDGNMALGLPTPYMLTEWGFKDAAEPIIKSIGQKDSLEQRDYDYEYFIAVYQEDQPDDSI